MAYTGSVSRWFNRKGYGFIKVLTPGSEHTDNDFFVHLSGINSPNDGYKSVSYGNLTALLIEAIKEQSKEMDNLKEQIKELQNGTTK